jgi:UDP-3-O-[3-hydroxymyristoyl] glucosamine N-acyltransferase
MKLQVLADKLGCRLEGDGRVEISRVARIEDAAPGDVTFLANPKYLSKLPLTRASAVIADEAIAAAPCAILRTADPYLAFAEAVAILNPSEPLPSGVSPLAAIDSSAELADGVAVGAFVSIGACVRIGAGTVIFPHVTIGAGAAIGSGCVIHAHASVREGVVLGDRVVLQDAAVIGSDGFGFARRRDGSHQKIPQVGRVVIEDDVEIGAHTAVDRPALGETRIASGTKIDNLVQVAHGVRIGRHALLAAQSGIAGSSELGDAVVLAGQSGVTGHVRVGRGSTVGAKSVVTKDIEPGQHVTGIPAVDLDQWREMIVLLRRLPELRQRIRDLETRLAAVEDARVRPQPK